MPEEIWITDTTFRDGQQSRAPYTTEQIVKIFDYLHQLGGPNGIIRQSEFFLYSKKDRDAFGVFTSTNSYICSSNDNKLLCGFKYTFRFSITVPPLIVLLYHCIQ